MDIASDRPTGTVGGKVRAAELRASLAAAADWLERHRDAIDALNVFPVPDGDTGINMSLTLRAAAEEAMTADGSLGEVALAMARGAVMGARGNSGMILAHLLRGIARSLESHEAVDARLLAAALTAGAESAYAEVSNPVEGTILTVARRAAQAAREAAAESLDLIATLERAHDAAQAAVAETPDQLPILKQASVVDAGGEGLRVLIEGILRHFKGDPMGSGPLPVGMRVDFATLHAEAHDFYGYCTEVLFKGERLQPDAIRERLVALGSCVLAVGDSDLMKVHVHTLRPGAVLDMATELGEVVRVKVDNMQMQQRDFAASQHGPAEQDAPKTRKQGTSVVAVALGEGFQAIFAAEHATVVRVAQTMNPSVQEILDAIGRTDRTDVVVLPNDRNALMAAQQAAREAGGRVVEVVPTMSMPAGIAAMLAVSPDGPASANAPRMAEAAGRCHSIEITRAVRTVRIDEVDIEEGLLFATLDGSPVATGESCRDLILAAAARLAEPPEQVATIYVGHGGSQQVAEQMAEPLRSLLSIDVEIAVGGQPHPDYVISVE